MYVHLDCNNFFVSCELVRRPELRGTPVVVANNNDNNGGIILALNQEAKNAGLKRGNPIFQVKQLVDKHHVTVIDVHHNLYHEVSHHIMSVVKEKEMVLHFVQYSVDEFFGEMPDDDPIRLRGYLQQLKELIQREADIPVSCGAGGTYTLAKTATHFAKRYAGYRGICVMTPDKREKALSILPIEQVWGIGRRRVSTIKTYSMETALDFAKQDESWVRRLFGVNAVRIWKELNGQPAITLTSHEKQKSIMYSRTFAHMTSSEAVLKRDLSNYATAAARRLRSQKALCRTVTIFLTTNRHREDLPQYQNEATLKLPSATDDSSQIINAVEYLLGNIYRAGYQYKQAGVILGQLQHSSGVQLDLFLPNQASDTSRQKRLMQAIDGINSRYGSNQIHFAIQGQDAEDEQMAGFMRPHKIDDESDD